MDIRMTFGPGAPSKKENIMFRPRVNSLLQKAAEHPLVTVTAGTGYGKSQAVASYLQHSGSGNIWLQLTGLDNYPARFWNIFTHAAETLDPKLAEEMRSIGFPGSMDKLYTFLRAFTRSVYARGGFALVFDDFHKVQDASVIHFVETMCFSGIENLTIFLITRRPLMLDYSGLQTQELLYNVSAADLRFTYEETATYFNNLGLALSDDVLERTHNSTEGWPLAVYLIALHLQRDGHLLDDPIDCTIPLLYKLIDMEIYSEYSLPVQKIFIKLSLMESVPLNLLKLISGNLFADMVVHLRENMFVSYNPQTEQYYFHRLLRRFLREQRVLFSKKELARAYLIIGDWYKDQGLVLEALYFYRKSGNHVRMWQIIRQFSDYNAGIKFVTLCIELADSFPPEFIEANPLIRVVRAFMLLHTDQLELAWRHNWELKEEYESLPESPGRRSILGEVYLQLAHLCIMRHSYDFADYYRKACDCLPDGSQIISAKQRYVGAHNALHLFSSEKGEMDRMLATLFEVMPAASRVMNGCGTGLEYLAAAEGNFHRDRIEVARTYANKAIEVAEGANQHDIVYNAMLVLIRIAFNRGDAQTVFDSFELLHKFTDEIGDEYMASLDDIGEGWMLAHIGHPEKIAAWITETPAIVPISSPIGVGKESIVRALCMYHNKEYYQLLAFLDRMIQSYKHRGLTILLMYSYNIKALALFRTGNLDSALLTLQAAYALAQGDGIVMPFIEYCNDMLALLDAVRDMEHGFDMAWFNNVYSQAGSYNKKRLSVAQEYERRNRLATAVHTTLTEREKQALHALCQGFTREEIAAKLSISVNTVKTTLKSIFSKLGAINRADAVRIAIDNKILD